MKPPLSFDDVPAGAILAALDMMRPVPEGEAAGPAVEEAGALMSTWGVPELARAFSLLISAAMTVVRPSDGDLLHVVVPAVVTRLCEDPDAAPFVPMMAGALTAAALFDDAGWRWRPGFGEVNRRELGAWCRTAFLLADMADTLIYQEKGAFAGIVAGIITENG